MAREGPLPWWHPGRLWFWMILIVATWVISLVFIELMVEDDAVMDDFGLFEDAHFVAEADAACIAAGDRVPPPAGENATFEERAAGVEILALILDDLADDLAVIAVVDAGREEVDGWIEDMRSFADVGRDYAAALRTGDPDVYEPAGNAGDDLAFDINVFSEAYGLDGCLALLGSG